VDIMGRLIGQRLSMALGQQVIVENRPGAGSTIAGRAAASAEPDGYTLLVGSAATMAIGPALYPSAGYDAVKDFAPVGFIAVVPYVMVAGLKVPANNVKELIALAKANPGKLNFGLPNGAPPHMIGAWFRDVTKTDIVIVPYRGASGVLTDMMGNQAGAGCNHQRHDRPRCDDEYHGDEEKRREQFPVHAQISCGTLDVVIRESG
jgi:tripartite-type tricarboxylate transporter receptor subunit TctC